MKTKKIFFKTICIFAFAFCKLSFLNAQNPGGTCTVLHQPCDSDGVMVVNIFTSAGMVFPLTYVYQDYYNSTNIIHSNIYSLSDTLSNFIFGYYSIQVIDSIGHQALIASPVLTEPFYYDNPIINNPICPSNIGTAEFTINGGAVPSSVQWYIADNALPGQYFTTGNPANLPVGIYTAIITDLNGCIRFYKDSGGVYILQQSNINFDVITTPANCTNGTASIINITGGVEPYTYNWVNGANTQAISNLLSDYYYVTVTDSLGCSEQNYAYVSQAININVNSSITYATCLGNDGSVTLFGSGGTPPYTYLYSNGLTGQTITGLSGGTQLDVTATDANGCIGSDWVYINSSSPISVNYSSTISSCTAPTGSATLSISGGTSPYIIDWNILPPQSGLTLNNVEAGQYSFKVTDYIGCIRTGTVYISAQSSFYSPYINTTNYSCPNNFGSASVNIGGSNPPFNFLWNTGATTQNISNIPAGYYSCTITDNVGCSIIKGGTVHMISQINIGFSLMPASCIFTNDGSIQAIATGGTPPYSYNWNNGQIGQNAINLHSGWYNVNVHDANGCTQNDYTYLSYDPNNDSCYCRITGKVFVDQNNDCIYDTTETLVEHIMIHCTGIGYSFTNSNGIYSFLVPSGNYNLSESVQYIYPLASCQNNSININATASQGCTIIQDFANIINPLHDIHIIRTSLNQAIPGYTYYQKFIVENEGTISESNIQLGFKHDGQLQYNNTFPNIYTQLSPVINPDWYSVNSGFPNLLPGASVILNTNYLVPTNIPLATIVNFFDTTAYSSPMNNWLVDYTPWNNVCNYQTTIVGSFDPNFKEVIPKGNDEEGFITNSDSVLTYIIHFQNTGSYYAQNIVITDTLDSDLNWLSLRPSYSDHNYTAEISELGILKFTFANINLGYSYNVNDISTMGMVTYSVKLKKNLIAGAQIKNNAAIFFDYNAPIMTNTTLNTITYGAEIKELNYSQNINVYPNPFNYKTTIEFSNPNNSLYNLKIIDITGKEVRTIGNIRSNKIEIEKGNLRNGFYTIELIGEKILRGKIIIN